MATFHDLTTAQLKQAVQIREQIESLQEKLAVLLGGTTPKAKPGRPAAKRIEPAAGPSKLGTAPKWRFAHVVSPLDTLMDGAPKKKGLTAAGRAKLSAAMKARWAAKKKAAE